MQSVHTPKAADKIRSIHEAVKTKIGLANLPTSDVVNTIDDKLTAAYEQDQEAMPFTRREIMDWAFLYASGRLYFLDIED